MCIWLQMIRIIITKDAPILNNNSNAAGLTYCWVQGGLTGLHKYHLVPKKWYKNHFRSFGSFVLKILFCNKTAIMVTYSNQIWNNSRARSVCCLLTLQEWGRISASVWPCSYNAGMMIDYLGITFNYEGSNQ